MKLTEQIKSVINETVSSNNTHIANTENYMKEIKSKQEEVKGLKDQYAKTGESTLIDSIQQAETELKDMEERLCIMKSACNKPPVFTGSVDDIKAQVAEDIEPFKLATKKDNVIKALNSLKTAIEAYEQTGNELTNYIGQLSQLKRSLSSEQLETIASALEEKRLDFIVTGKDIQGINGLCKSIEMLPVRHSSLINMILDSKY